MTIEIAVIPVAGLGTRLLPATKSQPKEMLPVGRKPVVQYVVEELAACGIRQMLFITGPGKTSIENHFDIDEELVRYLRETGREELLQDLQFERQPVEYFYTRQRRQLGLGHAVLCAHSFVGERPFVVALGDSILGLHAQSDIVRQMTEQFERSGADMVIAFEEVPPEDVVHYGIARVRGTPGEVFELESLVEKPSPDEAPSCLAVAARYVFSPAIFSALARTRPDPRGEIQLTDAVSRMLESGARGVGMRLPPGQKRYDIGNLDSYFRTFTEFALADPQYGPRLQDHVRRLLNGEAAPPPGS
jgi:UTP--glucose-1-phosphate uridylyltransferase